MADKVTTVPVTSGVGSSSRGRDIEEAVAAALDNIQAIEEPGVMSQDRADAIWSKIYAALRLTDDVTRQVFRARFAQHVYLSSTSTTQDFTLQVEANGTKYSLRRVVNGDVLPPELFRQFWRSPINLAMLQFASNHPATDEKARQIASRTTYPMGTHRARFDLAEYFTDLNDGERAIIKRVKSVKLAKPNETEDAANAITEDPGTSGGFGGGSGGDRRGNYDF